ncbi:MAG: DUF6666 family protein [Planctomycetia bacterium]
MNVLHGSKHLVAAGIAATLLVAAARADGGAQPAAQSQLKWTPHRASNGNATAANADAAEAAPPAQVTASPATARPSGPPASITLPDGVPPVAAAPGRRPAPPAAPSYAPMRDRSTYRSANRVPGPMRQAVTPDSSNGLLGFDLDRAPQGEVGRPILAPEGRQVASMERAAGRGPAPRTQPSRLGGGIAPRYTPDGAGRPERLAMNAEGIPSVMRQAPSVGGIDDAGVPGRTPPGSGAAESLPAPSAAAEGSPVIEMQPDGQEMMPGGYDPDAMTMPGDGMLMGEYPPELHVESFYDDPYEGEDEECEMCIPHGRICAYLRRFGKPYYGWRWYRDFTASAGITAFTNSSDLGIFGNYGTNEYLNWAMPFWNAFGVGWQVGWRGTQTNFQPASIEVGTATIDKNARTQNFVTTGFFTRAFEGRGLQGGAVYDYLSDNWFDNVDVSQIRAEISYVWGYHEIGFWGAANLGDQTGLFGPITRNNGLASTLDLYTGFYRLQFGDANEWKVWGGGTSENDGIIGTLVRAPMGRSLAMEGTFTYVIPGQTQLIDHVPGGAVSQYSPSAWNLAVNIVYYPAGRSRRSLASPYRPLFEVADNGSMIRTLSASP